jgi:hypothetical protein
MTRQLAIGVAISLILLFSLYCGNESELDEVGQTTASSQQPQQDGALEMDDESEVVDKHPELKRRTSPFPTGEVFEPTELFRGRHKLDRRVREANPRLYVYEDFDPDADPIVVVGMPGWGGRSENYIWILINGLKRKGLTHRLVIASIQDLTNGGPRYQGQGARANANTWIVTPECVAGMRHFLSKLAGKVGSTLDVYLHGFSTGGVSAPVLATKVAKASSDEGFRMAGAVAMGTESRVSAELLREHDMRVLFLVVPVRRIGEPKPMRDDQWNRMKAEKALARLQGAGARAYLRHVVSARRHTDWHWGLVSQCRYFRSSRIDSGRGYWPNYWKPNPETTAYLSAFLLGEEPPPEGTGSQPPTPCPY